MSTDDTDPPVVLDPGEDPFNFGDRTLFQLRAQPFTIEKDYGTLRVPGARDRVAASSRMPAVEVAVERTTDDPIVRLEKKVDAALRLIEGLQHQLDSIDAILARVVNR